MPYVIGCKRKNSIENLLVVVDDLALPFGTLRLKSKGSDGGHKGLKNIQEVLGTQHYARLRFGIGDDYPPGSRVDYVLSDFTDEEKELLLNVLKRHVMLSALFVFPA